MAGALATTVAPLRRPVADLPSPLRSVVANALRVSAEHPRPAAVFDADGTMWGPRDSGLQFLRWLSDNGHLAPEGQRHADKLLPVVAAGTSAEQQVAAVAKGLAGIREEELASLARRFVRANLAPAIFGPMREAVLELQAGGVDVRVVSAAPQPLLDAVGPHLGLQPGKLHGVQVEVKDGQLTDQLAGPMPYGEGKVAAIQAALADARIVLGVGDSQADLPMLGLVHPGGTRLLVNATPETQINDAVRLSFDRSQTRGSSSAIGSLGHYGDRPDIRALDARTPTRSTSPFVTRQTRRYWKAELEMVAKLIEMYPDRELYFMARDAEGLGDMARLVGAADPTVAARVHLLNVSTRSVTDSNLLDYLEQEGLSSESIRAGKKFLFVDTGFRGSIPKALEALFANDGPSPGQFQTHMVFAAVDTTHFAASEVSHLPNSRVFVGAVDPRLPGLDYDGSSRTNAAAMKLVQAYALLPKATPKATTYTRFEGRWQPTGDGVDRYDGAIDLRQATVQMQAKKAWFDSPRAQHMLQHRRGIWRDVSKLQRDSTTHRLVEKLRGLTGTPAGASIVRDALELFNTNRHASGTHVAFADVGLSPQMQHGSVAAVRDAVLGQAHLEGADHVTTLWETKQYDHLARALEHFGTRTEEIAALRRGPPDARQRLEAVMEALAIGMAGIADAPSTQKLIQPFTALEDPGLYRAYGKAIFDHASAAGQIGSEVVEVVKRAPPSAFDQLLESFQYQVQSRPDERASRNLPLIKRLVSEAHERKSTSMSIFFLQSRLLQTRDPTVLDPQLLMGIAREAAAQHRRIGNTSSATRSYEEMSEILRLPEFGSAFDALRLLLADTSTENRTRALLENRE